MRTAIKALVVSAVTFLVACQASDALLTRIKDIASISGLTEHKLMGYGLIVGLEGTGDSSRATFTVQSLANMLERFGVSVDAGQLRVKNVAAVMVVAASTSARAVTRSRRTTPWWGGSPAAPP